ncbi:MAG: acetolactate synthase small subunit, partial [Acidobacteriota bacterium]
IEITGTQDKLTALINLMQRFGIKEIARTGAVAMRRSMQ